MCEENRTSLLLATGNPNKLWHWQNLFEEYFSGIVIQGPNESTYPPLDVEERSDSEAKYFDNALIKAKAYWDKYHCPVLADDSGLEISRLNGWPGIITGRALKEGVNGKTQADGIIESLREYPDYHDRTAEYHTCVVFIDRRGHIFYCNTVRYGWVGKIKMGENCNEVEKVFIPYQPFMRLDECPDDDDERSIRTLGILNILRKYGQHYQAAIAYPVADEVPVADFMSTVTYLVTKDLYDDSDILEEYPYLKIGKPYEFRVPELPQSLVEKIHTAVF